MKKVKILSHPTQINTIQLDDLDYDTGTSANDKVTRLQVRRWRKLRHELV
ncbi:MAG: hypothetical protein AAB834_02060 [Patescibacteria group bacterium]